MCRLLAVELAHREHRGFSPPGPLMLIPVQPLPGFLKPGKESSGGGWGGGGGGASGLDSNGENQEGREDVFYHSF